MLSWIDICAGLAAKTFSRGPCVTASVDAVHFLRPCHVSSQLAMQAGRHSCLCSWSTRIRLQSGLLLCTLLSLEKLVLAEVQHRLTALCCTRLPLPAGGVCVCHCCNGQPYLPHQHGSGCEGGGGRQQDGCSPPLLQVRGVCCCCRRVCCRGACEAPAWVRLLHPTCHFEAVLAPHAVCHRFNPCLLALPGATPPTPPLQCLSHLCGLEPQG